jgi:hypothetical protein
MAFLTNGLVFVRGICASKGTSEIWLKVLAAAEHKVVPSAVERSTGMLTGSGESATPDIAVRTTRNVSRVFASWEYILRVRPTVNGGTGLYIPTEDDSGGVDSVVGGEWIAYDASVRADTSRGGLDIRVLLSVWLLVKKLLCRHLFDKWPGETSILSLRLDAENIREI